MRFSQQSWFGLFFCLILSFCYFIIFPILEFQIIPFMISTFTPIFFIEISFVLPPPPSFLPSVDSGEGLLQPATTSRGSWRTAFDEDDQPLSPMELEVCCEYGFTSVQKTESVNPRKLSIFCRYFSNRSEALVVKEQRIYSCIYDRLIVSRNSSSIGNMKFWFMVHKM